MLPRMLLMSGLTLIALGGWLYYDSLPQPLCIIENHEREVDATSKSIQDVVFKLTNPTNETVRVLGLSGRCGVNGCLSPKTESPFEVPPRSSCDMVCKLTVGYPGEFSGQVYCYLADPHLREIVLSVSGVAK